MTDLDALRTAAGYARRATSVLSLAGPDARRFANGMFTNNVRDLPVARMNQNAMVDDRARIQGLFDLWCVEPERFLVVLDGPTAEEFTARYEKYIIFDDVELEPLSLQVHTVQGPLAADVLRRAGLPAPPEEGQIEGLVARRSRSRAGGYDILSEGPLTFDCPEVSQDALEVVRIEAGLVRWPVDMGEKSLVHEMRLVERACNFNKGCYIGQEVINRIDVMGQVTKKVWGLTMDEIPPPNTPVKLGEEAVGHTLSGAMDGPTARVLAILRKAAWQPGLQLDVGGKPATVHDF